MLGRRWGRMALVAGVLMATLAGVGAGPATSATPGTATTAVGGLGSGPATDVAISPIGLAVRDGRLVIADSPRPPPPIGMPWPGVIRTVDLATGMSNVLAGLGPGGYAGDGGPATLAQFDRPRGLAFDAAGNVLVADSSGGRVRKITANGQISTVAGNGTTGSGGDGGPATAASLHPWRVQSSPDGALLIEDLLQIRRVSPSGVISTVAGGGPERPWGTAPTVDTVRPRGLAVDGQGTMYFVDTVSSRLHRLTADGTLTALSEQSYFLGPIAVEPSGNLVVVYGNTVRRVDQATGRTTIVAGIEGSNVAYGGDGGPATQAHLQSITDIAVDERGVIYVADTGNLRVRRIGLDGIITTVAGNGLRYHSGEGRPAATVQLGWITHLVSGPTGTYFIERNDEDGIHALQAVGADGRLRTITRSDANGLAVDPAGNAYLTEGAQVVQVSPRGVRTVIAGTGQRGYTGDGGPAVLAELWSPGALALDGAGNLYVADSKPVDRSLVPTIRRISVAGRITTIAGDDAQPSSEYGPRLASQTSFRDIRSLAVDARGRLLVGSNRSLLRITCGVAGSPSTMGESPLEVYTTFGPLAVDSAGAMYRTTTDGGVYREDSSGTITKIAGKGTAPFAEGRPATSLRINGVGGIAVDASGDVLVATEGRIIRISGSAAPRATPGVPCDTVPDRPIWGWGWNVLGQLGDGTTADRSGPAFEDPPLTGVVAAAGGAFHSLALKADGTVWAWGWNGYGQLGDGTNGMRTAPVQVAGLTGVTAIAAGGYGSMAVKSDGTVWAWGWNAFGQLGDGTTADRWRPVRVAGLSNVKTVAMNVVHSLAVKSDGTVWAWGWNGYGFLGDGTNAGRVVPRPVVGLDGVTSVAAGYFHSAAVKADGTVWTWGWNALGQLGDGTTVDRWLPTRVGGLFEATAVAAGNYHTVALVGRNAWAWGWDHFGQVSGQPGTVPYRPLPHRMTTSTVTAVAAGAYHTLQLWDGGQVTAYGWNHFAQATTASPGARTMGIAAGAYHTLAFVDFTP